MYILSEWTVYNMYNINYQLSVCRFSSNFSMQRVGISLESYHKLNLNIYFMVPLFNIIGLIDRVQQ